MNTFLTATVGLAAAVDFFVVTVATGFSAIGLVMALVGLRMKSLKLAAAGCVPVIPAMFITAMGLHYALTVSPEEDIDAAGYTTPWVVGLSIATVCLIGALLCVSKIRRIRRAPLGIAPPERM